METIRGKQSRKLDLCDLVQLITGYERLVLDLGTGDGRYVRTLARQQPDCFVIGVDACRENLRETSRSEQPNLLFVIAEAQHLPPELSGRVSHITINFPWGSLLEGLLSADPMVMQAVGQAAGSHASLDVRLNAGALAESGRTLEAGADRIHGNLLRWGWLCEAPRVMDGAGLRAFPSTWARRLAHGRDPRAIEIHARLVHRASDP